MLLYNPILIEPGVILSSLSCLNLVAWVLWFLIKLKVCQFNWFVQRTNYYFYIYVPASFCVNMLYFLKNYFPSSTTSCFTCFWVEFSICFRPKLVFVYFLAASCIMTFVCWPTKFPRRKCLTTLVILKSLYFKSFFVPVSSILSDFFECKEPQSG